MHIFSLPILSHRLNLDICQYFNIPMQEPFLLNINILIIVDFMSL